MWHHAWYVKNSVCARFEARLSVVLEVAVLVVLCVTSRIRIESALLILKLLIGVLILISARI